MIRIMERELISQIQNMQTQSLGDSKLKTILGIGDDAAILQAGDVKVAISKDVLVEGVHFDESFCKPEDIGYKACAVNLSDIAAMKVPSKFDWFITA